MEESETRDEVLKLGKKLADKFSSYEEGDTISQWMSHYIAELIVEAETAKGNKRVAIQGKCFNAILDLWRHQSQFPRGSRPVESFESIFRALESLDPENKSSRYFKSASKPEKRLSKQQDEMLTIIAGLDNAARSTISYLFEFLSRDIADEDTLEWINLQKKTLEVDELSVVIRLLPYDREEQDMVQKAVNERINTLNSRIEKLSAFKEMLDPVIELMEAEIDHLKGGQEEGQ